MTDCIELKFEGLFSSIEEICSRSNNLTYIGFIYSKKNYDHHFKDYDNIIIDQSYPVAKHQYPFDPESIRVVMYNGKYYEAITNSWNTTTYLYLYPQNINPEDYMFEKDVSLVVEVWDDGCIWTFYDPVFDGKYGFENPNDIDAKKLYEETTSRGGYTPRLYYKGKFISHKEAQKWVNGKLVFQ